MKKISYLVKKIEYTAGVVIFMLISLIGIFLAILSWGVAVFSIVDILFINAPESFLIYKAWGCVSIVFIFLSHPLFYLVMYTNVYDRIIAWIKSCSTNGLVVFTFGYINTYFLDLYIYLASGQEEDIRCRIGAIAFSVPGHTIARFSSCCTTRTPKVCRTVATRASG